MRLAASAADLIKSVEDKHVKKRLPKFTPGDTVRVTVRVPEGEKERTQVFEGVVIRTRGGKTRQMLTVRKISFGVGVERTFPLHSPFLTRIEVVHGGKTRRARLYYLREKSGKDARLKAEYFVQEGEPAEAAPEPATSAEKPAEAAPQPKAEDKPKPAKKARK